jgi:hypothetical protein
MYRLRGVLMSLRQAIISRAMIWPPLGWKLTPIVMLSESESKLVLLFYLLSTLVFFFSRLKCEKNKIRVYWFNFM